MRLLVFSSKSFEIPYIETANKHVHQIDYVSDALDENTAIKAKGYHAISLFSGDDANIGVLETLWENGIRHIAFRSTGYNNINLKAALHMGFKVANVPNYSPHAIAEHAVALMLSLTRKLQIAYGNVSSYNFQQDDLVGINLHGKTVGIIGTGGIGSMVAKIMNGFGCKILAHDLKENTLLSEFCDLTYTSIDTLLKKADIITLHIPLTAETRGLIHKDRMALMKKTSLLINTARGPIVDHSALLNALENENISGYAADVYENENEVFFKNHPKSGPKNNQLKRLLRLPNVVITPHVAFATSEALKNIARIMFENLHAWEKGKPCENELTV